MKKRIVVLTDCVDVAWQEIRGAIYSNCRNCDIEIEPIVSVDSYSIVNVNFLVKLIAEIYPEGTIICVIVNPLKERTERIVGRCKKKNIIFEGTNTGAFSWLLKDFGCEEIYELHDPGFVPFGGKYVHAPAVGKIASGISLDKLGNPFDVNKIRQVKMQDGMVIHIDNFGNLKLYHRFKDNPQDGDKYLIRINGEELVATYNKRMMAKDDGEIIIYPGSSFGYTEIGIVRDHFSSKYNVKNGDMIKIERMKNMKKIMLSGGRPTGKLHLGHYVGAFKTFAELQNEYDNYFIISDIHMLTTKSTKKEIDTILNNSLNMVIDAIGMGIDPSKTTFYLQSQIPSLSHIFGIFQNYVKLDRVNNTPSLLEMSKHSNQDEVSLGLVAYPVLEAADVFALKADLVPVGKDNIDHIKITQEILRKLNNEFHSNFKIPDYITTDNNHIVGIDGSLKMSKSLDNAIYIRDSKEDIIRKVNSMRWYTKNEKAINVVMEYIKIFASKEDYDVIYDKYVKNILSEQEAKEFLINILERVISPMRERMKPYIDNPYLAFKLLYEGTMKVKKIADNSMLELRNAVGLVDLEKESKKLIKR